MKKHRGKWFRQRLIVKLNIWLLIALIPAVFYLGQALADTAGDDFNDNSKDTTKWGTDEVNGHGHLTETSGHLDYTCGVGTILDSSDRPWIISRFPYNADWTIQIDATNNTSPTGDQWSSFGINVRSAIDQENEIEVELEADPGGVNAFLTELHCSGFPFPCGTTTQIAVSKSSPISISFNSSTKVLTVSYYYGSQWVDFGSFGVAGSEGANGNADWGLTDTDQFIAYVFGYSKNMAVSDGQLYGDNFLETGGVTPVIVAPGPTGRFRFAFPASNPLLTAILHLTGNYKGFDSWFNLQKRNYVMDVAQDESGKLSGMGTMDGVINKSGKPEITGTGAITTVNGKPSVQLKGSFSGTFDGVAATATTTISGPVELTDISGGTPGFIGTGSLKGKLGGVPFKGTREVFDAPEGTLDNLKKNWTLQLDITSKQGARGKTYIVASAQLILPNGDTIVFGEKRTAYNAKTGYTVSFWRGTNITVNPQKIDTKTSVSIKSMTLSKQGNVWQPTGGTLTYKFFGQKGSGNLLDLIAP